MLSIIVKFSQEIGFPDYSFIFYLPVFSTITMEHCLPQLKHVHYLLAKQSHSANGSTEVMYKFIILTFSFMHGPDFYLAGRVWELQWLHSLAITLDFGWLMAGICMTKYTKKWPLLSIVTFICITVTAKGSGQVVGYKMLYKYIRNHGPWCEELTG